MVKKKVIKSRPKTNVCFVLDESGSMGVFRDKVIERVNANFDELRKRSKDQDITVSLVKFSYSSKITPIFCNIPIESISNLILPNYIPDGNTALLDATDFAVNMTEKAVQDKETSFLLLVFTDGCENNSVKFNPLQLQKTINRLQATDMWTITFEVPHGYKETVLKLGVYAGNIAEWEVSEQGFRASTYSSNAAISNYMGVRSAGATYSSNYHSMTSDLSNVTQAQVKKDLDDVSDFYKVCKVEKEADIKNFYETKMRRNFTKGKTFYQLTKTEKIQLDKEILIMEKGKKAIWAGTKARDILGLAKDKDSRVKPGNHANWDIFVQSKADNRILVRGSVALIKTI